MFWVWLGALRVYYVALEFHFFTKLIFFLRESNSPFFASFEDLFEPVHKFIRVLPVHNDVVDQLVDSRYTRQGFVCSGAKFIAGRCP